MVWRTKITGRLIEKLLIESAKGTDGIITSESFSNELSTSANSSPINTVTDPFSLLYLGKPLLCLSIIYHN